MNTISFSLKEELIKFGRWLTIQTDEVGYITAAPCRRYKNRIFTIEELYEIYIKGE